MDFPELDELVEKCDYNTKLAITRWVFKHLVDHANDGRSYRYLIYQRLGFNNDAYVPLCDDGLHLSNELNFNVKPTVIQALAKNDIDSAKRFLGCCDVSGCFEEAGCGWPSDEGYRWTCGKHYEGKMKNV